MELSRERKIVIGIFGTAIAALGIDRGLLGPSEASAAAPVEIAQSPLSPVGEASSPMQTGGVGQTIAIFAERLRGLESADPLGGGDAFAVPAAWLAVEATGQDALAPEGAAGPPANRLTSVMPTQSGGIAIIDGRTYRQGETVGAFVLETVEPRSVVLRRGDTLYRLGLAE